MSKQKSKLLRQESKIVADCWNKVKMSVLEEDLYDKSGIISTEQVFANAEVDLGYITTYGFDYDYTIAHYLNECSAMIYEEVLRYMIDGMGYPVEMGKLSYDSKFAIRGLHFDRVTGYLMKLSQFSRIQPGTVYYGRNRVPMMEVNNRFPGFRISDDYIKENLRMIGDLFALPEACLIADVTQFLSDNSIDFTPAYLFADIRNSFEKIHTENILHRNIMNEPDKYIDICRPKLVEMIRRLKKNSKNIFLLTNSGQEFVNFGCKRIFKELVDDPNIGITHWTQLFDVVIVSAGKPDWYDTQHNFRRLDHITGSLSLHPVKEFKSGEVYLKGSLSEFAKLAKFKMSEVIYMGDNIYSDLRSPRKAGKWRTVGIIKELEYEITKASTSEYRNSLKLVIEIEKLLNKIQSMKHENSDVLPEELELVFNQMKQERKKQLDILRNVFNPHFGSIFRTMSAPSKLFYNVGRYADIYTSDVANFLHYPIDMIMYVKRQYFPHEDNIETKLSTTPSTPKAIFK